MNLTRNQMGGEMAGKHTQGKWRADRRQIMTGSGTNLRVIAEVFSGATDSLEEANANERLIAAAPELFEALINARLALTIAIKSNWHDATDHDFSQHKLIKQIDAVIAKVMDQSEGKEAS